MNEKAPVFYSSFIVLSSSFVLKSGNIIFPAASLGTAPARKACKLLPPRLARGSDESATKGKRLLQLRGRLLRALTILFCVCACAGPTAAQQTATNSATDTPAQTPYRVGEKLTYSVSFSTFASAAHVELLVAGRGTYFDRAGIELRAHVATVEAVRAAIYSINNDYVAYIDPKTGLPFHTQLIKSAPDPPPTVTSGSLATDSEIINAGTKSEDSAPATFDLL